MSLVNDMLRDLEARRASPAERAPLEGLLPADEGASGRRAGRQRLLLGLLWGALAVLTALLLARIWLADEAPVTAAAPATLAPAATASTSAAVPAPAEATPPIRLLATLPQHGDGRFILQLLLDRAPSYRRSEQSGVVGLRLPQLRLSDDGPRSGRFEQGGRSLSWSLQSLGDGAELLLLDRAPSYRRSEQSGVVGLRLPQLRLSDDGPRSGRFEQGGRSLSWSLQPLGDGAELLLVGLGDDLQVLDRLEPAGERWQLWVEVPLEPRVQAGFGPEDLPVAGAEEEAEADVYPSARQAPAAEPARIQPAERLAAAPANPARPAPAVAAPVSRTPQVSAARVSVASHQPDTLVEARQALLAGDNERAIALLEDLNHRQPDNREALRWLARAWLSVGRHERLIAELPAQLQRFPTDSELRVLLARALLQSGDGAAAVATLAERMPPLASDPAYHALLAASYQQTAQWRESAQLYRNLVQLRPAHGAWQLGLGIALEQLGERAAAAQHYRQALQGQGLDEDSRRYARERAQASGGES